MKWIVALLFLLVVGIPWWFLPIWTGKSTGRGIIFSQEELDKSQYIGQGRFSEQTEAEILVNPRGIGVPFFLKATEDISLYQNSQYKITELSPQDKLLYVVGKVKGWESIEGSADKYLVLESGQYRIGLASSDLYGYEMEDVTSLFVEDVSKRLDEAINAIQRPKTAKLSAIGYERMRKIVKRGDSVVLIPVFDPPAWSSRDETGHYIVAQMIIRRGGGV